MVYLDEFQRIGNWHGTGWSPLSLSTILFAIRRTLIASINGLLFHPKPMLLTHGYRRE